MKRFFLLKDIRTKPVIFYYKTYKGYYRKNQKMKWLLLTVPEFDKKKNILYKKRLQLVRIKVNDKGIGVVY